MIPALSQNSLPVGILMNRASFPRLPGDIGNPATFPFAVRYRMVPGTTYHDVVEALQEERLLVPFIAAAQALEQEGVCAITTSCGFLALFQRQLSAAVRVPVYTSALLQLPMIAAALPPGKRVGILTADSANLTPRHLAAAGASYCAANRGAPGAAGVPGPKRGQYHPQLRRPALQACGWPAHHWRR